MEALSTISQIPILKEQRQAYCQQAINEILSGEVQPLKIDLQLKALEEIIKTIRKDKRVSDYVFEEAEKYGKSFDFEGAKITLSGKKTYDYSGCGDQVYNDLIEQQKTLDAQIKAREMMLQAGSNPETGEVYNPPVVKVTNVLTYRF